MTFVAIIPAGGAGTRLWPLSRRSKPKFLLDMTGAGRTLIQATANRLGGLVDDLIVVTGSDHAPQVAEQLGLSDSQIVIEPSPRGTMPAIGLVAAIVEQRHGSDAVVGSFAADHLIADTKAFQDAVRTAIASAEAGAVATIGITPTNPDTGFGYIDVGEETLVSGSFLVNRFLEKPSLESATRYVDSGTFLWNAGMFVARAGVLLDALAKYKPELASGLREIAKAWDTESRTQALLGWDDLEDSVIDRAIAEPLADEGGVTTVPVSMGWSDIGGYASLAEHLDDPAKQVSENGTQQTVVLSASAGSVVYAHDRPIVIHGVPNAVVIDTGDALLVTTKQAAAGLGGVVSSLPDDLTRLR